MTLRAEPVFGGNTDFAGGAQKTPEAAELTAVAAFRKCEAGVGRVSTVAFAHLFSVRLVRTAYVTGTRVALVGNDIGMGQGEPGTEKVPQENAPCRCRSARCPARSSAASQFGCFWWWVFNGLRAGDEGPFVIDAVD